jgi:hypothetical protein
LAGHAPACSSTSSAADETAQLFRFFPTADADEAATDAAVAATVAVWSDVVATWSDAVAADLEAGGVGFGKAAHVQLDGWQNLLRHHAGRAIGTAGRVGGAVTAAVFGLLVLALVLALALVLMLVLVLVLVLVLLVPLAAVAAAVTLEPAAAKPLLGCGSRKSIERVAAAVFAAANASGVAAAFASSTSRAISALTSAYSFC